MAGPTVKPPGREGVRLTAEGLAFSESICHLCANVRHVATKTSTFVMCTALPTKYPRQPIAECPAFSQRGSPRL